MQILPNLLPYQTIIYQTKYTKGRLIAIIRNEQAVLRQYSLRYPLNIDVKDNSEFILHEEFRSGGKGLTQFNCIIRAKGAEGEEGTELEARIIPQKVLKIAYQVWTAFLLLALASGIASLLLGLFYSKEMFMFLWMIIPSGAMIFFLAAGVRRLLNQQIRRYRRILEAVLRPHEIHYYQ